QSRSAGAVRALEVFEDDDGDLRSLRRPEHRSVAAQCDRTAKQQKSGKGKLPQNRRFHSECSLMLCRVGQQVTQEYLIVQQRLLRVAKSDFPSLATGKCKPLSLRVRNSVC